MRNREEENEGHFTVEPSFNRHLKNIAITGGSSENILLEDTIGKLVHAFFPEGVMLEVIVKNGVLCVDLRQAQLQASVQKAPEITTDSNLKNAKKEGGVKHK